MEQEPSKSAHQDLGRAILDRINEESPLKSPRLRLEVVETQHGPANATHDSNSTSRVGAVHSEFGGVSSAIAE